MLEEIVAAASDTSRREPPELPGTLYLAVSDVVSVSLALGSVKLRRAQALTGDARDAMLLEAERAFLAIRTQAEGQPEFHLGLGEIYARLGKTAESEAELTALIDRGDPGLSLQVAQVYRDIGSVERATQVATDVHAKAASPMREYAAVQLALLTSDDPETAEGWYRKADQANPFVRVSLLEIEGAQLARQGKYAECAARFAETAKAHLAMASAANLSGYNNAAIAHQRRYDCTGDLSALRDAEVTLEKAYRARPDEPIVVGNLSAMLMQDAQVRVLAKRIDVRALKLSGAAANELIGVLNADGERAAILAELTADPGWRRSDELLAQFEVLAPNSTHAYQRAFATASRRRDPIAAAAILERMRRAKALDTSSAADLRSRWTSGALDAREIEEGTAIIAHATAVAARPRLDARTRAAALYLAGEKRAQLGLLQGDAAAIATGRGELIAAMQLWPALDANADVVSGLIDEAGVAAEATRWNALRRNATAIAALAAEADASAPLAATIRASAPWAQVAAFARADTTPREVVDIRLARLLGDAALLARANAAFDDPLVRIGLEVRRLGDPSDPNPAAELALLDRGRQ